MEDIEPVYATIVFPDDRIPIVLTREGKAKMTGYFLETVGMEPIGYRNEYPVYDHVILPEEAIPTAPVTVYKTKTGWQYGGACPVWLGEARYYRNFAD